MQIHAGRRKRRPIHRVDERFDIIVANLYAELLVSLSPEILRCCRSRLALAGILADRKDMVLAAFSEMSLIRSEVEGDWISLWFER